MARPSSNYLLVYADLDDLHIKVRDAFVRRLFGEAIASFRASSFRGATVTLWTAVVFDIVAKLRELELSGDAQAASHLRDFEQARQRNDLESALRFEREILAVARDRFELLTYQEHDDLSRLQADRNRCAHPSMNSADEAYMPSAELVRYHLYSAAQHLFVRPPVQGKAALQHLFNEVRSPYFPRDVPGAARVLRGGPLGSAKPSLLRNFVVASLKASLIGAEATDTRQSAPILVALAAAKTFAPAEVSAVVADVLPRLSQQVSPESVGRILRLGSALSDALDHVPDDVAGRLEAYIRAMPDEDLNPALVVGLGHPRFNAVSREKLAPLTARQLVALVSPNPACAAGNAEIVARVVEVYSNSRSWDMSNSLGPLAVAPLGAAVTWADVQRILEAVSRNGELTHAFTTQEVITRLRELHPQQAQEFDALGQRLGLGGHFPSLFPTSVAAISAESDAGEGEPLF